MYTTAAVAAGFRRRGPFPSSSSQFLRGAPHQDYLWKRDTLAVAMQIEDVDMLTTQEANKILRRNHRNLAIGKAAVVMVYGLRVLFFVISILFWAVTIVLMASALNSRSGRRR